MFDPKEREIFPYYNGNPNGKVVMGDPIYLRRKLTEELGGNPAKWIDDYNSQDLARSLPATEKLIGAVRAAFKMMPYDDATGQGAMEKDVLEALAEFLTFEESKKKSLENLPKSRPVSPEPMKSGVISKPSEPMKSSMVSGSTARESGFSKPLASLRESGPALAQGG